MIENNHDWYLPWLQSCIVGGVVLSGILSVLNRIGFRRG